MGWHWLALLVGVVDPLQAPADGGLSLGESPGGMAAALLCSGWAEVPVLCPLPGAAPVAVSSGQAGPDTVWGTVWAGATLPRCHHLTLHVPRTVWVTHPKGSWDAEVTPTAGSS